MFTRGQFKVCDDEYSLRCSISCFTVKSVSQFKNEKCVQGH